MQSRLCEKSVLLKCYLYKPAATDYITKYFECIRKLFTITCFINNRFVYNHYKERTDVIVPVIWCYKKHSILSSDSIIEIHFVTFLNSKSVEYYYRNGCDSQTFMVFITLLLCCNEKLLEFKIKSRLNISNIFLVRRLKVLLIQLATHYVTCCVASCIGLECFIIYLFLFQPLKQVEKIVISLQALDFLNGRYINSDMEVDEKTEIKKNIKTDISQEETGGFHYGLGGNKDDYTAVIKNIQNMKESECTQVNNSFRCVSYNDNTDFKHNSAEIMANGDLVNCLISGSDNTDSKKLNSISDLSNATVDSTLTDTNIKKEHVYNCSEMNGTDFLHTCTVKENETLGEESKDKVIKVEENLNSYDLKSTDGSEEKDKAKLKDHLGSNNLVCQPTSTKKVDEQSSSHHSSSSSSSSKSKYKDYKGSSHRSSSSSKSSSERSKQNDSSKSKHESDKKKSRSCHHKSDEKCHCKSHHHSRHHSKKSKRFQSVKTQCTADEIAYELRSNKMEISNPYFTRVPWVPHPQLTNLKYGRYYRIEVDRNGGASIVHLYMDEISHLSESQMKECAVEFIKLSYSEDENECAYHVMGIVHGAASYLPDLVDYMADHYPTLIVKTGSLASRDNHTTTMSQYRDEVYKTYSNGTFRYAPLDQLSICGVLGEEVGAYFPDFVARLEQSPFMKPVMPWSSLSVVETDNPRESNDGPIFWVRPGEQMLPANEALKESARPKKRRNNELDNLAYIAGSRSSEARESLFMDRTKAHADQVGVDYGLSNTAPTAAVGVLKSVNCGHPEHGNRATKDVIAFHAQDYNELLEILMLDLYEPPQTQCTKWIEVSKLNTLRREGIRYAHVQLHDNDVYYLPRKIIHQFQTISSVASVAWHIRYKDYFSIMGAPNLHTPTGINKGQVFYEKKNVAVYYPPVCENELLASVTNPGSPLVKTPKKCEKLKDYSPFKHSPRKNHKIHSPRTNSKKEKGSDSVPQTPSKRDLESVPNDDEKKNSSGRKDHVRLDDGGENSSKRERESSSSKKLNKSENSNHYQTSDHSSTKKERKETHESSSNHRKEVKNLEADFDLKRSKSKSGKSSSKTKSEKSGHDGRRRSDEGKCESSYRHKRHEEYKSKSYAKSDKNSSHKKAETIHQVSNGSFVENSVEGEEKIDKSSSRKRKNSESQDSSFFKKIKDDSCQRDDIVMENGGVGESSLLFEDRSVSESEMFCANSNINVSGISDTKEVDTNDSNRNFTCVSNVAEESGNADATDIPKYPSAKCEPIESNADIKIEQTDGFNLMNAAEFNDLRQSMSSRDSFISLSHINPPLPCTSPPSNPPLPPNSPVTDVPMVPHCATPDANDLDVKEDGSCGSSSSPVLAPANIEESSSGTPSQRDPQEPSILSKDKNNDLLQARKLKKKVLKKIVKEESENYDLLGDIMSQMDKKK